MDDLRIADPDLDVESAGRTTPLDPRGRRRRPRRRTLMLGVVALVGIAGVLGSVARWSGDHDERVASGGETTAQAGRVSFGDPNLPTGDVPASSEDIAREISASVDEASLASTPTVAGDQVLVAIQTGHDRVADALVARYGERVAVSIDLTAWPPSRGDAPAACDRETPTSTIQGVSAVLEVDELQTSFAENIRGTVTVRNDTDATVRVKQVNGAWIEGVLRSPSGELTGGLMRGELLVDSHVEVQPGDAQSVPMLITPVSCTPWNGSAVQPGQYDAIAIVRLSDGRALASTPVNVAIVEATG